MQKGSHFKLSVEDTLYRKNPDPPLPSPQKKEWKDGRDGAGTWVLCEPLSGAAGGRCLTRGGKLGAAGDGQTGRTLPVPMGPCHPVPSDTSGCYPEITSKDGGDEVGLRWRREVASVSWGQRSLARHTMATAQLM